MTTSVYNVGDEVRSEIRRQIGRVYILMISGGRVTALADGIELPVGAGYRVRVRYNRAGDDYTVERVFIRGGVGHSHGLRERVYCDEVAEVAYRASCFRSYDDNEF